MEDLQKLETAALLDMLALYTEKYTQFLSDGSIHEEHKDYPLIIKRLQSEIEARHRATQQNKTTPDSTS
ncbi:MAG TPA: hypothetical protein VK498_00075 [Ferruginibacter sp.]|nr:hypothetical protein [Ferruginibacter sp.]